MKILEDVLISNLTTMRLGGAAKYTIEISAVEDIISAYNFAKEKGLKTFILGGGANSIGLDEGFDGVILLNKLRGIEIIGETETETFVRGMGGEVWDDFVEFTTKRDLSGIEALSKIPGSLGAAPVQNIGAYGQDIAQVLENVEAFDSLTNKIVTIPKSEMNFDYRKSIFNYGEDKGRYFIIAVTVRVSKNKTLEPPFYTSLQNYIDKNNVTDFSPSNIRKIVSLIRAEKLPDPQEIASSGSFFKNIYVDDKKAAELEAMGARIWQSEAGNKVNSGWLIEEAGLKGKTFHGMTVNDKAALVLMNESAKSYSDLAAAREEIRKIIRDRFNVELEQEPVEIK